MFIGQTSLRVPLALLLATAVAGSVCGQGVPVTSQMPRPEEVRTLVAALESSTAPLHQKVLACHRLAIIGTKDAVPALAALLGDKQLAHYARYALEPMSDPAAGAALRNALGQLKGMLLVGAINSIGFRHDAAATTELSSLLAGSDEQVATAAAAALGRIGTPAAAKHLQAALGRATGAMQIALTDSSLTCADALVAARKQREAAAIFDRMVGTGFPDHIRTAAMCGAIMARGGDGVGLLVQQLKNDDQAMLAAAWRAARELSGTSVTKALAVELGKMPEAKKVSLIQVLGDRGDTAALPAVLAAAKSQAPGVRVAALQVLPRLDDGQSTVPVLLQAVTAGQSPAETEAALAGLGQVGGPDANAKILAALPSVPTAIRVKLIGVLATRRAENARGELMKLAGGADRELSKAAFRALATVGRPVDLPELIKLSTSIRDDAVKVPADLAVYSVSMKVMPAEKRGDAVVAALRTATDPATKCSLLRPLGAIVRATGGRAEVYDTIQSALNDSDLEVRTAALRCLADWPDARPAGFLLETARTTSNSTDRELALRGGIRMAANIASGRDKTPLDALDWFMQANRLVQGTGEKLMIVSGLGSLGRIEGLKMLQPYLEDPAVQTEAALAVVELSPSLANTPHAQAVKAVLEEIGKTSKDADVRRKADRAAKAIRTKS